MSFSLCHISNTHSIGRHYSLLVRYWLAMGVSHLTNWQYDFTFKYITYQFCHCHCTCHCASCVCVCDESFSDQVSSVDWAVQCNVSLSFSICIHLPATISHSFIHTLTLLALFPGSVQYFVGQVRCSCNLISLRQLISMSQLPQFADRRVTA